ncbi:MAG TPA: hypothetical protein VLA24_05655 [Pseudomonadales bacterium]|nr:hypothetical protein [Pseudomonadales bacterium]
MAEAEDNNQASAPEEAFIKRINLNRWLMIIALVISVGVAIISSVAVYLLYSSVPDYDQAANSEAILLKRIEELEGSVARLAKFKGEELAKLQAVADKAADLEQQCSGGFSGDLLVAMQQREKDFQLLVDSVATSARELASMTRGGRDWLVAHEAALRALRDKSVQREVNLQYVGDVE